MIQMNLRTKINYINIVTLYIVSVKIYKSIYSAYSKIHT